MNRIFLCLLGLPALIATMSASSQTADGANRCTLELLDGRLDASRFEIHENLTWQGNSATLALPNSGTQIKILGRNLPQSEVYDSAALDCDLPAVVRILVSLSTNNAVEAAALLPSAQSGAIFGIPVLPRFGDYLFAAQNSHGSEANCRIELLDESGARVGDFRTLSVPGTGTVNGYLSDLAEVPADFGGGSATVSCDRQIAATGMLAGVAWSGLPPTVLSRGHAAAGFAPDSSTAFDRFVVGNRFVSVDDSRYYTEFPSAGQFVEVEPSVRYTGTYSYVNTGPDTGTLTQNFSDGDVCTVQITWTSATTGSSQYTCSLGEIGTGDWRLEDSSTATIRLSRMKAEAAARTVRPT